MGLWIGVVIVRWSARRGAGLRPWLVGALVTGAVAGAYVYARRQYFGHWLPNTFALKGSHGLQSPGIDYLVGFVRAVLGPYLVLTVLFSIRRRARAAPTLWPVVLAGVAFATYLATIVPIQGLQWRFVQPVFPSLLAGCAFALEGRAWPAPTRRPVLVAGMILAGSLVWTLRPWEATRRDLALRPHQDRAVAGKALRGLDGRMLVSEAGALPFYSQWQTLDLLGLTSEEVAREGLRMETIADFAPDLIMTIGRHFSPADARHRLLSAYMQRERFVAVAAVMKTPGVHHFYFVRRHSPLWKETVERLSTLPEVSYASLVQVQRDRAIPLLRGAPAVR